MKKLKIKYKPRENQQRIQNFKRSSKFKHRSDRKIKTLFKKIKEVNQNLWDIEDKLRFCEKNKDFGKNFIELARGVYFNNDKRSKIKSEINKILMSNIKEVKEYVQY